MFTSRPSDPRTVLLWGNRWWFPGSAEPREFQNGTHAAEVLAAHFADEPKPVRLRLIFQPDSLESAVTPCPPGNRATLAQALAGEFPALADPARAWGHEPVLGGPDGHATILHCEKQPVLLDLASRLARLGLAVESAWPLLTFLHALPDEWTDSGGITVIALESRRALAYRHPAEGVRTVEQWSGESTAAQVGQWLAGILTEEKQEPVLLVSAEEETTGLFDSYLEPEMRAGPDVIRLPEAIGRPVVLPRYHPAQLLPRPPAVTAQRAVIAAGLALFFAAGWQALLVAKDWRASDTAARAGETRLAALRTETAHLKANAAEIAELRRQLEDGASGPPLAAFLQRVAATMPAELMLASVRVAGRNIELGGWIAPTAPAGVLDSWRIQLTPGDAPWTVSVKPGAAGAFNLTGIFRP